LQKGINLIAVLPKMVKSPLLTAEWEHKLKAVERGELAETAFMDGIADMTRKLVTNHFAPIPEYTTLFTPMSVPARDVIGVCPRCGGDVAERDKGFFCSNRACKFALWKDNRFFEAKKKKLTKTVAVALLKEGRVFFPDLYSERTGKTYAAAIMLETTGDKASYKLEFNRRNNQ
jgi:DNA topoisomerase-3